MKWGILQIQIPEDICGNPTIHFSEIFQHVARLISWLCNLTSRNFKYDGLKGTQVDKKKYDRSFSEAYDNPIFLDSINLRSSFSHVCPNSLKKYIHTSSPPNWGMYSFSHVPIHVLHWPLLLLPISLCASCTNQYHHHHPHHITKKKRWVMDGIENQRETMTYVANWTPVRRRCGHGRSNSSHSQACQAEFAALLSHLEWKCNREIWSQRDRSIKLRIRGLLLLRIQVFCTSVEDYSSSCVA